MTVLQVRPNLPFVHRIQFLPLLKNTVLQLSPRFSATWTFVLFTTSFLTICEQDAVGPIIKYTLDSGPCQTTHVPVLHYSKGNTWEWLNLLHVLSSQSLLSHFTLELLHWKCPCQGHQWPLFCHMPLSILNLYLTLSTFNTFSLQLLLFFFKYFFPFAPG